MSNSRNSDLTAAVACAAEAPVAPEIELLAGHLRARHGDAALAVLAYGSCLRGVALDDSLVDLYVLVSRYRDAHTNRIAAATNRLLPPNVYYLEHAVGARTLRAKCAVISLEQFEHKVSADTRSPYFWARFAQPCALVEARNDAVRARVHDALATAARTAYRNGLALAGSSANWRELWTALLEATYRTELRPESTSRAASIVTAGAEHFQRISGILEREDGSTVSPVVTNWFWRRAAGKALSAARLVKAGFTFAGGAEYIAWKISRHSGVDIEVTPWQRRHPILAAIAMAPKLYRKGGFR